MNSGVDPSELSFRENLEGRIQNLAMSPSYANTLIPVFEAVMNSLQSIQDRFGNEWADKGRIVIETITDEDDNPHSFSITDNGIGLDEDNFKSFRTYDSRKKQQRGWGSVAAIACLAAPFWAWRLCAPSRRHILKPTHAKITRLISCATPKGGSEPLGASACRGGNFWKLCAMVTNTRKKHWRQVPAHRSSATNQKGQTQSAQPASR